MVWKPLQHTLTGSTIGSSISRLIYFLPHRKTERHQSSKCSTPLQGIVKPRFQSKISTEFPHHFGVAQTLLLSFSQTVVFFDILCKGCEVGPGRGAILGLAQHQPPPAERAHEALRVQGLGVAANPEMEEEVLGFHVQEAL